MGDPCLASPRTGPIPYPGRVRGGPDWLTFIGNWMTEWERTGETKYRDKIIAGMDSIAKMPEGITNPPDYWKVLTEVVSPEKGLPHFRNVKISDIKAVDAQRAFSVGSYKDSPLENFEFKNLDIEAKIAGSIQYADHWTFANTHIQTADGSVIKLQDCRNVTGLGEK